jgi:hypothetical protein
VGVPKGARTYVKFGCVTSGTTYTVDDGVENADDEPTACTVMGMAPIVSLYEN